jgi:hypothetical protein
MSKFLAVCFLVGVVSMPNITATADALPVSAVPASPNTTSGKRVEVYATNLKMDLEKQEAILMRFIKGLQADHSNRNARLKSLQITLSDLKAKLVNATQNYNVYDRQVVSQERQYKPLDASFKRARDMYDKDMKNLKEEKEFVDALLKYIRLKKC